MTNMVEGADPKFFMFLFFMGQGNIRTNMRLDSLFA